MNALELSAQEIVDHVRRIGGTIGVEVDDLLLDRQPSPYLGGQLRRQKTEIIALLKAELGELTTDELLDHATTPRDEEPFTYITIYCRRCGNDTEDGAKMCPACLGTPKGEESVPW